MPQPLNALVVMGPIAQGGAEWQLLELLRRLDRTRVRPVLVSVEFSSYQDLQIGPGDEAIRREYAALGIPQYRVSGHARGSTRNARELMRIIRRERVDVVHTNLYAGETWGRLAAILTRTPIVTHKRGMPFKSRKPVHVLADWLLNLMSSRIIVVNHTIRRELQRLQRLPDEKFTVIFPGIQRDKWKRATHAEVAQLRESLGLSAKQVVMSVGRLRALKGQQYLLRAAPAILRERPDTRILLVGHGSQEADLSALAQELGVEEQVLFLGGRTDIRELLSLTDVFVLPSLSEASPVVLMEAAFVGVASVATWVGGVAEIVRDGVTGTLVPPANPDALASAVVGMLRDDALRARMGQEAVAWAEQAFDVERTVRQVEAEYHRAAGRTC